jgi:predicted alpha/beta superfamily hydrolase
MWRVRGAVVFLVWITGMTYGKLLPEAKMESRFLGSSRIIRVYLPPSYESQPRRRYPVLYLHDGQNVFSSSGTNCCFGWGSWEVDKTVDSLVAQGRMREIIMVAADNSRFRYAEYRGRLHATGEISSRRRGRGETNMFDNNRFEAYANFLIKELKPRIDREYRTQRSAADTAVMGSSLGGICSASLAWEYPKTFGAAGSLSGAFQIEKTNFIKNVLRPYDGRPRPVRFYLDSGIVDFTGDDDGRRQTDAVADELRRVGWKDGKNLLRFTDLKPLGESHLAMLDLRRDKWAEAQKSQHNEFYWRIRVWRALEFLFPPGK